MLIRIATAAAVLALAGCFEKKEGAPSSAYAEAEKERARLTGDDKGAAADNPVCKLFKPKELEQYIGEKLGPPQNATGGCQWVTNDEVGDVEIGVVAARYYEPHEGETYREISGIGSKAFSARFLDSWQASAVTGEDAVSVMVAGDKATRETAEALLRETIRRRGVK